MAPKQQLEKNAWQWAETTDPEAIEQKHVETAYRLELKACKTSCRRNCAGNPHCLNGLGEREWLKDIDDRAWHDIEDPEGERRKKESYVGLKNLGATCYVNTFLQVWFHNMVFRQTIYRWLEKPEGCVPPGGGCDVPSLANGIYGTGVGKSEMELAATSDLCRSPINKDAEVKVEGQLNGEIASTEGQPATGAVSAVGMMSKEELEKTLAPSTVCGHLQLMFALLQFSNRRYVDPSPFIKFLGLDAGAQQDAQEFSKLLISLLEENLRAADDPNIQTLIQDQFSGTYEYVTSCNTCGGGSQRPSQFYELELNIKGHSTLDGCIKEYLQDEKLEGDNQYFCEQCSQKRNATRQIKLRRLPQVLNFQLLRFVFDRKTGHKKKLNTFIQFGETLDMSSYMGLPDGKCMYELAAVLIHRGPSAYSGHYVAHIKTEDSDAWHKFNDEEIEKMGGKNLQLGNEEEIEGKSAKKPRTAKGFHASRNAYMLVYQRKEDKVPKVMETPVLTSLPQCVQDYVAIDNQHFEDWIIEMKKMRESNVTKGKARQEEIRELYKLMPVAQGASYEFITTEWLSKWFGATILQEVKPIDNQQLLCPHSCLSPEKVAKVKCISSEAAEIIYTKYNGAPRLPSDTSLCWDCVRERCRVIRTKAKVQEDSKIIAEVLRVKDLDADPMDSYWVGKASLRSWKKLVMEELERSMKKVTDKEDKKEEDSLLCETLSNSAETLPVDVDIPSSLGSVESVSSVRSPSKSGSQSVEVKETDNLKFNEDLLCEEHKQLDPDPSCRRLVPSELWHRLKSYFPSCPEFQGTDEECFQCRVRLDSRTCGEDYLYQEVPLPRETKFHIEIGGRLGQMADEAFKTETERRRKLAAAMKSSLMDLYLDRHHPVWKKDVSELCVVQHSFLDQMRNFIKDPVKYEPLEVTGNKAFLCDHGGFIYEPELIGHTESTSGLVLITPEMWRAVKTHVTGSVDAEVMVSRVEEEEGQVTFLCTPDVCKECCEARALADLNAQLSYTSATIYVRKVAPANDKSSQSQESQSPSHDPEFLQNNGKRKKSDPGGAQKQEKVQKLDPALVRRSTRHRRVRGEKEVTINCTQTLWDLKIQLMKLFSVAPMDQHILLDEVELKGDKVTLAEFKVTPNAVIHLRVDEVCDDNTFMEDIPKAQKEEQGFKGTGLLGR